MDENRVDTLLAAYEPQRKAFSGFMNNVVDFFQSDNDQLRASDGRFLIHSVKSRQKEISHLREKIERKSQQGRDINTENLFAQITDFCGVRALHLGLSDFSLIHAAIDKHVGDAHWCYAEKPKAYTWDPEYKEYFESCGVETEVKESFYTSVHYVVKPNPDTFVTCEIQVRSLFEEIWGEVDHQLNYPNPIDNISCREQLKVLAKLVGAGTKLVDSIYKTANAQSQK
jgi:ppGpp synthetase/RelA/SpoT-type nucleotidyltranferase